MLNFDFLEKGPGIVPSPNFVHNFSRKMFLALYLCQMLSEMSPIILPSEHFHTLLSESYKSVKLLT